MTERPVEVSGDVIALQRLASDPAASAWVTANAGAGKTHVLAQRVLRLLLTGVPPESMLCLTYTKAAAAEMRRRVARDLGEWTRLGDAELAGALARLQDRPPGAEELVRARTLFAHALDSPGGLKINTIHAFCESVLHRFPLEAGVPVDFEVLEDARRDEMVRNARETVLADGLAGDPALSHAVGTLFARLSDTQIENAVNEALAQPRHLRAVLADTAAAKARLRDLTSYDGRGEAELDAELVTATLLTEDVIAALTAAYNANPTKEGRFVDLVARMAHGAMTPQGMKRAFFTTAGSRRRLFTDPQAAREPALATLCEKEARRVEKLVEARRLALLIERSDALVDVLAAIESRYAARKRAAALLDFDDLVEKLDALFANEALRDWVLYKLDAAILHILVDESQDTNFEQWAVVKRIADEFFAGEGAIERERTLFAVGDEKQSIYSFQGAEPALFAETGRDYFGRALLAGKRWESVTLTSSFRTLPGILDAVDRVCAPDHIDAALKTVIDPVRHASARTDPGGQVTLWPCVKDEDQAALTEWPTDIRDFGKSATEQIAERISGEIRTWLAEGRLLGQRGRAVRPDDILILVQKRGALFHNIIRALKRAGIPTPGADRLSVSAHIAVLDLVALGDVLLNPADNLTLAALLRSPLFDISEEQLFAVCNPRAGGQSVWSALQALAATEPWAKAAHARLHRWRSRLDLGRPYEFFAHLLYAEDGLRRFHARLGPEIDDVLAEFLDLALAHELEPQPSLQGFLAAMRASDISIRRELSESGGGVRVMTVHGAKGLEAPIVILADAATSPAASQTSKPLYVIAGAPGPLLAHASRKADHVPETMRIRAADEAKQADEYWRKLYVAMTRAEDELYVTGYLTKMGKPENSWYEAIETALAPEAEICPHPVIGDVLVYPKALPGPAPLKEAAAPAGPAAAPPLPPLPDRPPRRLVQPSRAAGGAAPAEAEFALDGPAIAARDAEGARLEGLALHALLQHLPKIEPDQRLAVARKALAELYPQTPGRHADLAAAAIAIIAAPANASLFGPASRAEVAFSARGEQDGVPIEITGRIDRLVIEEGEVLVVDFKSDAAPPATAAEVSAAYLTQLGLYALVAENLFPERRIGAAILWTASRSLMSVPREALRTHIVGVRLERPA